jgi:hypothetical protein
MLVGLLKQLPGGHPLSVELTELVYTGVRVFCGTRPQLTTFVSDCLAAPLPATCLNRLFEALLESPVGLAELMWPSNEPTPSQGSLLVKCFQIAVDDGTASG